MTKLWLQQLKRGHLWRRHTDDNINPLAYYC